MGITGAVVWGGHSPAGGCLCPPSLLHVLLLKHGGSFSLPVLLPHGYLVHPALSWWDGHATGVLVWGVLILGAGVCQSICAKLTSGAAWPW